MYIAKKLNGAYLMILFLLLFLKNISININIKIINMKMKHFIIFQICFSKIYIFVFFIVRTVNLLISLLKRILVRVV